MYETLGLGILISPVKQIFPEINFLFPSKDIFSIENFNIPFLSERLKNVDILNLINLLKYLQIFLLQDSLFQKAECIISAILKINIFLL